MKIHLDRLVDYVAHLPTLAKSLVLIFATVIEYVFPIFPGDTVVLLAGFLHAQGAVDLAWTIISIIVGSLVGAYCGYQIGRWFLKNPHYNWAKRIVTSAAYGQFNQWFRAWGYWLLLFNRFIHGIRAVFFFAAGALSLPLLPVLALGVISSILWNGLLLILGYWLGFNAEAILGFIYSINFVVYVVIIVLVVLLVRWYHNQRNS